MKGKDGVRGWEAWTPEDKARAYAMADEGKTNREIAVALGCTRKRAESLLTYRHHHPRRKRLWRSKRSTGKRRNCLACGAPFLSEWIGNRLCPHCS